MYSDEQDKKEVEELANKIRQTGYPDICSAEEAAEILLDAGYSNSFSKDTVKSEDIEKIIEEHIGHFREDLLYINIKRKCAKAICLAYKKGELTKSDKER